MNRKESKECSEAEIDCLFERIKLSDDDKILILFRGLRAQQARVESGDQSIEWSHFISFTSTDANPFVVYSQLIKVIRYLDCQQQPTCEQQYVITTCPPKASKLDFIYQRQKNSLENFLLEFCYCVLLGICKDSTLPQELRVLASEAKCVTHNHLLKTLQGKGRGNNEPENANRKKMAVFYQPLTDLVLHLFREHNSLCERFLEDKLRHLYLNFFISTTIVRPRAEQYADGDMNVFKKLGIDKTDVSCMVRYKTSIGNESLLNYDSNDAAERISVKFRLKGEGEWVGIGMICGAETILYNSEGKEVSLYKTAVQEKQEYTSTSGERLQRENVIGNGDCLYESLVCAGGSGSTTTAAQMRTNIVAWMRTLLVRSGVILSETVLSVVNAGRTSLSADVEHLLAGMLESESAHSITLEEYLTAMATAGTWGGAAEVFAASRHLSRGIQINRAGIVRAIDLFMPPNPILPVLNIYYNGHNHYDALIGVNAMKTKK